MPKTKLTDKQRKERKEALKNESKYVRFKRVCTPRLRKALKSIRQIGACSTSSYAYNKEQTDKIETELINAVNAVINQFSGKANTENAVEL